MLGRIYQLEASAKTFSEYYRRGWKIFGENFRGILRGKNFTWRHFGHGEEFSMEENRISHHF